jgi:hypothetical protein
MSSRQCEYRARSSVGPRASRRWLQGVRRGPCGWPGRRPWVMLVGRDAALVRLGELLVRAAGREAPFLGRPPAHVERASARSPARLRPAAARCASARWRRGCSCGRRWPASSGSVPTAVAQVGGRAARRRWAPTSPVGVQFRRIVGSGVPGGGPSRPGRGGAGQVHPRRRRPSSSSSGRPWSAISASSTEARGRTRTRRSWRLGRRRVAQPAETGATAGRRRWSRWREASWPADM